MPFEIKIHPTGDTAEADCPEGAALAARTMIRDALECGTYYLRPTASFYANGHLVREGVNLADLTVPS